MNIAETLGTEAGKHVQPGPRSRADFEVIVVFTDTRSTLRALKAAGRLAHELGARIRLIVPRIVPHRARLNDHFIESAFLQLSLHTIVGTSKVETRVDVRLCRDRRELLKRALAPESIVVLGYDNHWRTVEDRLIRDLRAAGHHVMISPAEDE